MWRWLGKAETGSHKNPHPQPPVLKHTIARSISRSGTSGEAKCWCTTLGQSLVWKTKRLMSGDPKVLQKTEIPLLEGFIWSHTPQDQKKKKNSVNMPRIHVRDIYLLIWSHQQERQGQFRHSQEMMELLADTIIALSIYPTNTGGQALMRHPPVILLELVVALAEAGSSSTLLLPG